MRFPKIQSPCPYRNSLSDVMDGDTCRACKREVFDLTSMSDADRSIFLSACGTNVCVKFSLPVRQTVTAAAIAATSIIVPHMASAQTAESIYCSSETEEMMIIVGGLRADKEARSVSVEMIDYNPGLEVLPQMPSGETAQQIIDRMFGMDKQVQNVVTTDTAEDNKETTETLPPAS